MVAHEQAGKRVNADEQLRLGALLDMGLAHAGLEVVAPERAGASIVGYRPIGGAQLVATLLAARGCIVRLRNPALVSTGAHPGRAANATVLRLHRRGEP